jgi:hypothetical protein
MKKELQEKIFSKYDNLFHKRKLSIQESPMAWGIDVGDGWYKLIEELCFNIQKEIEDKGIKDFGFDQVKQKFGTLRIYNDGGNEAIEKLIEEAEKASASICEVCGKDGSLASAGGWFKVVCNEH